MDDRADQGELHEAEHRRIGEESTVPEKGDVDERPLDPSLATQEEQQPHDPDGHAPEHPRVGEPPFPGFLQPHDEQRQRDDEEEDARQVEPPGRVPQRRRLRHHGHQEREDRDRQVDVEDRRPTHVRREGAPQHRARDQRQHRDADVDAHGPTFPARRRGRDDDGAGRRLHEHGPDRLEDAESDEGLAGRGKTASERGEREHRDPDPERQALPDEIPDAAADRDERRERQQVRVHHPRLAGLAEAEVLRDLGERHPDDRGVHHDHRERPGHRDEDQSSPRRRHHVSLIFHAGHGIGSQPSTSEGAIRWTRPASRRSIRRVVPSGHLISTSERSSSSPRPNRTIGSFAHR